MARIPSDSKLKNLRAVFIAFAFLIAMALFEIFAQIGVQAKSLTGDFNSFQDYYTHLQKFDPATGALEMLRYDIKRHPYFGYVSRYGNNQGFRTPYDFPLKKEHNDFYIGIFGGSVAEQFADHSEHLVKLLKEKLPTLKSKNIKIVKLALGGYKQPQPYFIFSVFGDQLDMAIQIEGWNEVFITAGAAYPPEFPNDAPFLFSDDEEAYGSVDSFAKIRRGLTRWSAFLNAHPPLNSSAALFLTALATEQYLKNKAKKIADQAESGETISKTKAAEAQIAIWARYLKMQHLLAADKKVPLFTFIQPNQYALPGKKLTANETNCCFKPKKRPVEAFNKLRKKAHELAKKVPRLYDLNDLFVGEALDMYVDDCCHINEAGNKIMAEHISALIAGSYTGSSKGFTYAEATK